MDTCHHFTIDIKWILSRSPLLFRSLSIAVQSNISRSSIHNIDTGEDIDRYHLRRSNRDCSDIALAPFEVAIVPDRIIQAKHVLPLWCPTHASWPGQRTWMPSRLAWDCFPRRWSWYLRSYVMVSTKPSILDIALTTLTLLLSSRFLQQWGCFSRNRSLRRGSRDERCTIRHDGNEKTGWANETGTLEVALLVLLLLYHFLSPISRSLYRKFGRVDTYACV